MESRKFILPALHQSRPERDTWPVQAEIQAPQSQMKLPNFRYRGNGGKTNLGTFYDFIRVGVVGKKGI
jgi:hypothetical protein